MCSMLDESAQGKAFLNLRLKSKTGLTTAGIIMEAEMTRVSSRGQVVIPGLIREKLGLKDGSRLIVFGEGDTVILKKVGLSSAQGRSQTLSSIRKKVKDIGIIRRDVSREVVAVRAKRAKHPL